MHFQERPAPLDEEKKVAKKHKTITQIDEAAHLQEKISKEHPGAKVDGDVVLTPQQVQQVQSSFIPFLKHNLPELFHFSAPLIFANRDISEIFTPLFALIDNFLSHSILTRK